VEATVSEGEGIYGLQIGYVVNDADPQRLGRVTVCIPGLVEPESAWALPLGTGGGADRRGMFWAPDIGAEVGVLFKGGDVNAPYYLGANWGLLADERTPEVPEPVRTMTPADASKVKALETEHYLVTIDDRPGTKSLCLQDKTSGDVIEIDGVKQGIRIKGSYAVSIQAEGIVDIDAPIVTIRKRVVLTGKDTI
jgi:uncharacterized protein involved in type VI secretion and phage assembly